MDANASHSVPAEWAQRPTSALIRLAWPIAVSMLSISVMTLVDTLFVGWVGRGALAGVGLAGTVMFLTLCFPLGVLTGAKVLVSQAVGAERTDEIKPLMAGAMFWAITIGVSIVLVGNIALRWLPSLTSTPDAGQAAYTYAMIRLWAAPILLFGVSIRESRYGTGDARSPMVAAMVANVVNIALDYLLIFRAGMGVAGAAYATVIAQTAEASILIAVQARHGFPKHLPSARHIAAVWRMGLPGGLQWLLEMGAFATLAVMISVLSDVQMAAHQIALQVIHFSFLPSVAISESASVLCGQAIGARRPDLVRPVARRAFAVSGTYMALWSLVLVFGGRTIAMAFSDDPLLIEAVVRLFMIAAVFQVFDAANMSARGALRGTGDVRFAAAFAVMFSWGFTPPLMWLLGYRMGLGAAGGWIGLCFEIALGAGVFWWRVEREGWRPASEAARRLADEEGKPLAVATVP